MQKSKNDLPKNEEQTKWKQQLPEWLSTNKLTPPADL